MVDSDGVFGLVKWFFQASLVPERRNEKIDAKWFPQTASSSQVRGTKQTQSPKANPLETSSTPHPPQVGRFVGAVLLTSPLFQTPTTVQDEGRHGARVEEHTPSCYVQVG